MPAEPTWSKLTVKVLRSWNPRIRGRKGFASEMRALLNRLEGYDVKNEWQYHRPRFIPDAYAVDDKKEEVWVVEIEDTHALTLRKLQRLINFYWWLDAHYWKLRVFTANRYGQNISEVPLFSYHYALESPDDADPRVARLTDQQAMNLISISDRDRNDYIEKCLEENSRRELTRGRLAERRRLVEGRKSPPRGKGVKAKGRPVNLDIPKFRNET